MAKQLTNPLVIRLFETLKKRKVSVRRFARDANIELDKIYKWRSQGNNPKAEDVQKIQQWLAPTDSDNSLNSMAKEDENIYGEANGRLAVQAILKITESNKMLVELNKAVVDQNKTIVESNFVLAKNNEDLIAKLPVTGNGEKQIHPDVAAKFSDFLELLAQVGSGKRWKSAEEARAALNKLILVPGEKT